MDRTSTTVAEAARRAREEESPWDDRPSASELAGDQYMTPAEIRFQEDYWRERNG